MDPTDVLRMDALEQARLIAAKDLSCVELARIYLDRIDRLNPGLTAFVEVYRREALLVARVKDSMIRLGASLPSFHGVPIGIKDLALVRGRRSRFGSAAVIPFWSPIDDASVTPLRQAGFNILGKLATSELGAIPVTEPDIHPPSRNPWNTAHTPGGSSGGSAAAVAARLLPVAHGSDGGGSIRIPASFNGLVGLKPARGRLRNQFGFPDRQILYTTGALTRTVEESAVLLDIMAGIDTGKPHWAALPSEPFAHLARKKPRKLKIRLTLDSPLVQTDPEVRAATLATAQLLSRLGHQVEEIDYPKASVEDFLPIWCFAMSRMPGMRWKRAQPITRWLRDAGVKLDADKINADHLALEALLLSWFGDADVWMTPTSPILPPRVGAISQKGDPRTAFFKVAELGVFTALSNVTGQPAISIPAGISKTGLPIGVHFVGPIQGEAILLQLARQLEEEMPWKDRTCPI